MKIRLRFERIYGTKSKYGDKAHESPSGSPILLKNYPLPNEYTSIYLGKPVEKLYREYQIAKTGAYTLIKRNVLHEEVSELDEKNMLIKAQREPLRHDFSQWEWYISIVIEREVEVSDDQYIPSHWFAIDPAFAIEAEKEFLEYGAYQVDFIVDHLKQHIESHFFLTRDIDDRVIFFVEGHPPFKMFEVSFGDIQCSTSGPMHLFKIEQLTATMLELQGKEKLALKPLSSETLLSLVERATISELKGKALEELMCKLFLTIPGLKVMERVKTCTEEIDIAIFNNTATGFLSTEKTIILAECKNWSTKCGRNEFSILEMKAENRRKRCSLCFLISWNGFAGTIEKELLRSSRTDLVVVPLTGKDIRKAVVDNNFNHMIENAWQKTIFT